MMPSSTNHDLTPLEPPTDGLSITAFDRLERRFIDALRYAPGARSGLRLAVRRFVNELRAIDTPAETIRSMIRFVTTNHPERDDVGRVSMLTGEPEADRIARDMLRWADERSTKE